MMTHDLKTWGEPFQAILDGTKRFEFRKADRQFNVGDTLHLREYDPKTEKYSGRTLNVRITYVLKEGFGLQPGYCVMSIRRDYARIDGVVHIFDDK